MSHMAIFGWLSTFCLAVSGLPQAYKTWKEGHAQGLSFGMVSLWWFGEFFLLFYTWDNKSWPLFLNAILNGFVASYILWFKVFPSVAAGETSPPRETPRLVASSKK